jgi:molybdopterin-guanine dinucleotide biosynthesis protein A
MGRDKATLVIGGETLAARTARALAAVASPCVEVGPGVSGFAAVSEDPPGGGPLVAVAAGAAAVPGAPAALVVACDLPSLSVDLLRWLADHPAAGSVAPVWDGRPQLVCARWSAAALAVATDLVASGARSMHALLDRSDAVLVAPPAELAAALADVDTPSQLREVPGVDSG